MADLVFHDPTGRRARLVRLTGGLLVAFAALMVAAFFATLAFAPRLPEVTLKDPQVLSALHQETAHKLNVRDPVRRQRRTYSSTVSIVPCQVDRRSNPCA